MDNPMVSLSGNDIILKGEQANANSAYEDEEKYIDEEFFVKNIYYNKENIDEIIEKQTKFKNLYLNELMIYKVDD